MASAGIVHRVWDHPLYHENFLLTSRRPASLVFPGYVSVLPVVLRTNNYSPWTNEFDSKSNPSPNPCNQLDKEKKKKKRWVCQMLMWSHFISVPQRSSCRVWLSPFQQSIPESNGRRSQTTGRVMCTLSGRSQVMHQIRCLFCGIDMKRVFSITSCSYRRPGEQSCNQRTRHIIDNQCHKIGYGQVSLWGHRRWWPEVVWWDCDWPCCER